MPTRRRFLFLSSAAAACAAAPKLLLAESSQRLGIPVFSEAASGAAQQGILTAANFQKLIGSSFHAFLDNEVVIDVVLRAVKIPTATTPSSSKRVAVTSSGRPLSDLATRAPRTTNTFMLIFSTGDTLIPQDSYVLDSGTLGSFSAFLVPAQPVPGDQRAVATFNFL